jgi:hypothetical protein
MCVSEENSKIVHKIDENKVYFYPIVGANSVYRQIIGTSLTRKSRGSAFSPKSRL